MDGQMCRARKTKGGYKVSGVKRTYKSQAGAKREARKVSAAVHAGQGARKR